MASTSTSLGVRELKARLSESLKRVRAGQRLTVTDRGRAVAMLVPIESTRRLGWLDVMVADGSARWLGGKPTGMAKRIRSRGKPASRMVIEDRR